MLQVVWHSQHSPLLLLYVQPTQSKKQIQAVNNPAFHTSLGERKAAVPCRVCLVAVAPPASNTIIEVGVRLWPLGLLPPK
jgi:hypothetical protein